MTYKIHYDAATGEILERRPDDIEYPESIGDPWVSVSDDDFTASLDNNAYIDLETLRVTVKPPVPPTLEEAKAAKTAWNHAYADGLLAQAKAGYTLGEIESWDVQKRGAADILAGNTATEDAQDVTGLYNRRIAVGGETMTIEQFCQRILANAAAYRAYAANVNGVMQGIDAVIRRCETVEQVQAVVWPEM